MLEVDAGTGEEKDGDWSSDVIDRRPPSNGASDSGGSDPGQGSPIDPGDPPVKPWPMDENPRLPCQQDWPTHNNNKSFRHQPPPTGVKPEAEVTSAAAPSGGSRTTEVATALAGVHSVLDRIDDVSERQHVIGDVIVHLQVLRCRLQLTQVYQPIPTSIGQFLFIC